MPSIGSGTADVGAWFYPVNMAFATEHPVLAHSEYRPVEAMVRAGGRFEVVSEYEPPVTSLPPSTSWSAASRQGSATWCCWAPPAPASQPRQRG